MAKKVGWDAGFLAPALEAVLTGAIVIVVVGLVGVGVSSDWKSVWWMRGRDRDRIKKARRTQEHRNWSG